MLSLNSKKKAGSTVGLDIEAGSVAATELSANGTVRVERAGTVPLAPGAFHEGEVNDAESVAEALKELFGEQRLSKRVRLGIGNQRVVVRTVRLPAIEDPGEMEAAVRFQAQEQIPMPLEHAVLEHQVVGGVPSEEGSAPQVDVVVIAARRDMVSSFLEPVRSAGLEPVGVDLSAFGLIRALAGAAEAAAGDGGAAAAPASAEGVLYCNVGDVLNLAVARDRACLFTRVTEAGLEEITAHFAGERGLTVEHAGQWLAHVGLLEPLERIEGDPQIVAASRAALEAGLGGLVDEVRLSLDYYGAQESAVPVGRIVLSGPGSAIAGLPEAMEAGVGLPISASTPAALGEYGETAAARLTVPYGLALEE